MLVAFALSWTLLSRRFGADAKAAVAAGIVLAIAVADLIPAGADGAAPLGVLLAANVTFITLLLALAGIYSWNNGATGIAVLAGLAVAAFFDPSREGGGAWQPLIAHGVAMYLPFAVYPLVLGRRASGDRDPYVAALVASVWCFLATRQAVMQTDYASIIGAVPVILGAITTLHVRTLLQIERPGERDLGRLALVAGGALAFLTVGHSAAAPAAVDHDRLGARRCGGGVVVPARAASGVAVSPPSACSGPCSSAWPRIPRCSATSRAGPCAF